MTTIYRAQGSSLIEQYEDVGRLFARPLQQPIEISTLRMKIAEKVLMRVKATPALKLFYNCFAAWAKGAAITENKAMYLLTDNTSGCQTAIVRYGSGVALLHTEEDYYDVQARMNIAHTIEFMDDGRVLKTLVYNDLMPGAGLYGWQRDMIVAVDSLFLREDGIAQIEQPMLANIIAWQVWHAKANEAEAKKLVSSLKKLGTVIDGYAINVVRRDKSGIEGYKLTFARDDWEIEWLWDQPGDNLRQVNIIDPKYARAKKAVAKWRHAPWKMYLDYRGFLKRLREMKSSIEENKSYLTMTLPGNKLIAIHQAIQSKIFGEYRARFVSEWMGAGCVGLLDVRGLSVSTKLNDNRSLEVLEYVDILS